MHPRDPRRRGRLNIPVDIGVSELIPLLILSTTSTAPAHDCCAALGGDVGKSVVNDCSKRTEVLALRSINGIYCVVRIISPNPKILTSAVLNGVEIYTLGPKNQH